MSEAEESRRDKSGQPSGRRRKQRLYKVAALPSAPVQRMPQPRPFDTPHRGATLDKAVAPTTSGQAWDFTQVPSRHTESASAAPGVQAKLTVNAPHDAYEQEAEQVAESVMQRPDDALGGATESQNLVTPIQRIQRAGPPNSQGAAVPPGTEQQIERMKGRGEPLPDRERAFFEPRMGAEFSHVRLHTDATAVQTSRELGARAFTVGSDIAFNAGEYQPGTSAGRRLMAHELSHVVQQGAIPHSPTPVAQLETHPVKLAAPPSVQGSWIGNALRGIGRGLGSLARNVGQTILHTPKRMWRILKQFGRGGLGIVKWLGDGIARLFDGRGKLGEWFVDGLRDGAAWLGELSMQMLDMTGLPEVFQWMIELTNRTRALDPSEIEASMQVHAPFRIPYERVRVVEGSWLIGKNVSAFVSFNLIHVPEEGTMDPALAVHELTHVAQYTKLGSYYIPRAIINQQAGYDYGNLETARTKRRAFSTFHGEAQAQICEDYYRLLFMNGAGISSETLQDNPINYEANLKFYVGQMRQGRL